MKKCPFCAEEIQDAAVLCRYCNRTIPPPPSRAPTGRSWGWILKLAGLITAALVAGLVLLGLLAPHIFDSSGSSQERADRESFIDKLQREGVVTQLTCTGNTAQVNPLAWRVFNANAKRGMTIALAQYCDDRQSGNRMTVIDAQSGRPLASFGAFGYTVE